MSRLRHAWQQFPGSAWLARKLGPGPFANADVPQGENGVRLLGHRQYVGGMWDEIGKLQFHFLVSQGLAPNHYLCDLACGSLRGGVHFIRYLDAGHYLGIDKEASLIRAGIEHELGPELYRSRMPEFVVSSAFEIEQFSHRPDLVLAQSLFTHLPLASIQKCLKRLHSSLAPGGVFYATFLETAQARANPRRPHDHIPFYYTEGQLTDAAAACGWKAEYLGDWDHPRDQKMMRFRRTRSG